MMPGGEDRPTRAMDATLLPLLTPTHAFAFPLAAGVLTLLLVLTSTVAESASWPVQRQVSLTAAAVLLFAAFKDALEFSVPNRLARNSVIFVCAGAGIAHLIEGTYGVNALSSPLLPARLNFIRFGEWIATTPVLLLLLGQLRYQACMLHYPRKSSLTITHILSETQEIRRAHLADLAHAAAHDVAMLVVGAASSKVDSFRLGVAGTVWGFAHYLFVVKYMLVCLSEVAKSSHLRPRDVVSVRVVTVLCVVCWTSFGTLTALRRVGWIDDLTFEISVVVFDAVTKLLYSFSLGSGVFALTDLTRNMIEEQEKAIVNTQRNFFFNVSHELRTPLNAIIGFSSLVLESEELNERNSSFVRSSVTNAEILLGLVNQLLEYAKLDSASAGGTSIEMKAEDFSLLALFDSLMDVSMKASRRHVELYTYFDPPSLVMKPLVGDAFRVRQCLTNIVDNAIKYSRGVVKVRVAVVETKASETTIEFAIEDNGVGIPKDKQHTMFQAFSQPTSNVHEKRSGTGLGLVITKQIVESMNGMIAFESTEGAGSVFKITLPFKTRKAAAGAEDFAPCDQWIDKVQREQASTRQLPSNLRVVVFMEDAEMIKSMTGMLCVFGARPGHTFVASTATGDAGADRVKLASLIRGSFDTPDAFPICLIGTDAMAKHSAVLADLDCGLVVVDFAHRITDLDANPAYMKSSLSAPSKTKFVTKPVRPSSLLDALKAHVRRSVYGFRRNLSSAEFSAASPRISSELPPDENGVVAAPAPTEVAQPGPMPAREETMPTATATVTAKPVAKGAKKEKEQLGLHILLVEDNKLNQTMCRQILETVGCTMYVAHHGKRALEILDLCDESFDRNAPRVETDLAPALGSDGYDDDESAEDTAFSGGPYPVFDAIFMDMQMPVMDGIEATERIRALEADGHYGSRRHLIIGMSANAGEAYNEVIVKAGMDSSLSKPFFPRQLRQLLSQIKQGTVLGAGEPL